YQQTKAQLYGSEIRVDLHPHPLDWLHFENSLSLVYAQNLGSNDVNTHAGNRYLPFIPPVHSNSEIRAEIEKHIWKLRKMFFKVGVQYYAAQKRVYRDADTETETPSYSLWEASCGAHWNNRKNKIILILTVVANNIFDKAYQSHMSRLKYFDNYPVNGSGRSGIYSMGRNVSIKLTIPLEIKSN